MYRGEDIAPVALTVYEQVLLTHLHESIAYGSIAVWVELHGVTNDVSHLVVASIVHTLHRVQNTSLHRFEAILNVWDGALQNYV